MKRIQAKFKVVTPCFLGSAAHEAELRLPSIKGALRFWWRALNYARIAQKTNSIIAEELLRQEEGKLFGSSDQGQSPLIMRLDTKSLPKVEENEVLRNESGNVVGAGARYLGYGVMDFRGKLTRSCLKAPFEFDLQIGVREKDTEKLNQILPALKLLGLLGGLGSKSRKGYGSLNLISICNGNWQAPASEGDYEKCLLELLKTALQYESEPEISAFSSHARIDLTNTKFKRDTAMSVLNQYGEEMVRYRSWGRNGKILDNEFSKRKFKDDHDWAKRQLHNFHPRRAVFGLPHNYEKGIGVKPQNYDRRASPLFFHIHKINSGYIGITFLLRSRFLPSNERILANKQSVPAKPDWTVLTEFMGIVSTKTIWPQ